MIITYSVTVDITGLNRDDGILEDMPQAMSDEDVVRAYLYDTLCANCEYDGVGIDVTSVTRDEVELA